MEKNAERAVPSKALLALVDLWDLMEGVAEQNYANWDHALAEEHDAVLTAAWGIMVTMEDEIKACKANAQSANAGKTGRGAS